MSISATITLLTAKGLPVSPRLAGNMHANLFSLRATELLPLSITSALTLQTNWQWLPLCQRVTATWCCLLMITLASVLSCCSREREIHFLTSSTSRLCLEEHCRDVFSHKPVPLLCIAVLLGLILRSMEADGAMSGAKGVELVGHVLSAFVVMQGLDLPAK